MAKLEMKTEGDTSVVVSRQFAAAPEAVYRAHVEPELIQQWLYGSEGWSIPVCLVDARPGGSFRYEFTDGQGAGFSNTGEFVELSPFNRIVHVERMHLPDPTPDYNIETTFQANGDGTLLTMRMTWPDKKTRDEMLATGMDQGMEAGYVRLDSLI